MTLQSSGAISMADLAAEFGGSTPHALSEYYRGGNYVSSSQTQIPASGAISLGQFYGATNIVTEVINVAVGGTSGFKGYAGAGPFGSRSPATMRGATIRSLYSAPALSLPDFGVYVPPYVLVVLSGIWARDFFTAVTFQGHAALASAVSAHSNDGTDTTWRWDADPQVWAAVADGTVRTVTFTY